MTPTQSLPDSTPIAAAYCPSSDDSLTLCQGVMFLISEETVRILETALETARSLPAELQGVTFELEDAFPDHTGISDLQAYDEAVHSVDEDDEDEENDDLAQSISLTGEISTSGWLSLHGEIDGGTSATFSGCNAADLLTRIRALLPKSA